jgi:hypothetical protein
LSWLWSEPATSVYIWKTLTFGGGLHRFEAMASHDRLPSNGAPDPYPVQYRWDFGDGILSGQPGSSSIDRFFVCRGDNIYTVRVEVTDSYGNVALGSETIDISRSCAKPSTLDHLYLPTISR